MKQKSISTLNKGRARCVATIIALGVAVAGVLGLPSPPESRGDPVADKPTPQVYSPGIRIDWSRRIVELDATVVLRRGPLELLACSPHTREHESILAIPGRPRDIHHAMGLIGLEPGKPIRYDEATERILPPIGEPLSLTVRYSSIGKETTVPAERWLLDRNRNRPVESAKWVFAGSKTLADGRFGADLEGTIACVVDFETALIAIADLHSADNELLWLEANTEAIPPMGTKVVLTIGRNPGEPSIELTITKAGSFRLAGAPLSAKALSETVRELRAKHTSPTVRLRRAADVPDKTVADAIETLVHIGLDRRSIAVSEVAAPAPSSDKVGPG